MADFYFFADYDLLTPQASADAFNRDQQRKGYSRHYIQASNQYHPQSSVFYNGPTSQFDPVPIDEARAQKLSGAYAVCDGRIFVFKDTPSTTSELKLTPIVDIQQTATIVLQPSVQPAQGLPRIKYFIYKGILLKSLVDSQGQIIEDGRVSNSQSSYYYNNLTSQILDSNPNGVSAFSNALDLDYGVDSNYFETNLEEIFYRDNSNFQTFQVHGGDSIGFFNMQSSSTDTSIRIGIVFDSVDFHPTPHNLGSMGYTDDLATPFAFKLNTHYFNNFNGVTIQNSSTLNSYISKSLLNVNLNMLDPCAFYGSFAYNTADRLFARQFSDNFEVIPRVNLLPRRGKPVFRQQSADDLYTNLLSKFWNKNKIYIDIRNPENKSLNFYENYNDHVLLKVLNPTTASPKNIYANLSQIIANDDPNGSNDPFYLTLDPTFFGTGNASLNRIDIALPDGKTADFDYGPDTYTAVNNEFPSAYVDTTYLRASPLVAEFSASSFVARFIRNGNSGFSSVIPLKIENFNNDLQQPICTYIRIYYLKEQDTYIMPKPAPCQECETTIPFPNPPLGPQPHEDRTLRSYEYLDNFFTPFGMILPQVVPNVVPIGLSSNLYYDPKCLDNTRVGGNRMMAYPGIAQDSSGRITLFATAADIRTPQNNRVESGLSVTGMVVNGYLSPFLKFIADDYPGLKHEMHLLTAAEIGEPVDRFAERITGKLLGTEDERHHAFAWLTIEPNDYQKLIRINNSRTTNPEPNPNSSTPFTADFIVPSKTFLGTEIAATGQAHDVFTNELKDFIKYELILRNETLDSLGRVVFKSIRTGIYSLSLRVVGRDITDPAKSPSIFVDSLGVFIDSNGPDDWRIRSTVLLLPDANVKPDELYEFQQHVQCNIRQVWTNKTATNPGTGSHLNCGKYNVGLLFNPNSPTPAELIDAEQVVVKVGTGKDAAELPSGTVVFRVAKTGADELRDRPFVQFPSQIGVFFYNPTSPIGTPGRNRYVDAKYGENTPAHEFGHHMGLTDRYTSTGVANRSDLTIIGNLNGNVPMFMEDFAPYEAGNSFDPEFIKEYQWANNLYSTSETIYGATVPPTAGSPVGKIANEIIYNANFRDTRFPTSPNGELPPRYARICVYISAKQWAVIKQYPVTQLAEGAVAAADPNPTLFVGDYVFFKDYTTVFPAASGFSLNVVVSFVGFPAAPHVPRSDLRYTPFSTLSPDSIMNLRVFTPATVPNYGSPIDTVITDYFSPYTDVGTGAIDRNEVEGKPDELKNVVQSGLNLIQKVWDNPDIADKVDGVMKIIPGYDGRSTYIDLRVLDPYKNVGDGSPLGRAIWNYGIPQSTTIGIFSIDYFDHPSREKIIRRIQGQS